MTTTALNTVGADDSLVRLTHITYGLHAIGLAMGILGSSTVVGAFLGLPSLIALIINYVKQSDVRGTWLESHFRWQIRTFWFVLGWALLILLVSAPLLLLFGLGFVTGWLGLAALGIWAVYRIARGWLRLKDRETLPV